MSDPRNRKQLPPPLTLARCPFPNCNGEAMPVEVKIGGRFFKAVRCKDCGTIGPQYFSGAEDATRNAIVMWNSRR